MPSITSAIYGVIEELSIIGGQSSRGSSSSCCSSSSMGGKPYCERLISYVLCMYPSWSF